MGLYRGEAGVSPLRPDPVLMFGFTLACYGAIALALVSALPGDFALDRTGLVFAWLSVGGLIREIASTGPTSEQAVLATAADAPAQAKPLSRRLAFALTLTLNLMV